jgi:hypothetical protein
MEASASSMECAVLREESVPDEDDDDETSAFLAAVRRATAPDLTSPRSSHRKHSHLRQFCSGSIVSDEVFVEEEATVNARRRGKRTSRLKRTCTS